MRIAKYPRSLKENMDETTAFFDIIPVVWNRGAGAVFFACDFLICKKDTRKAQKLLLMTTNTPMTPIHTKKIIRFIITLKNYTYKSENTLITPLHIKN